MLNPIKTRVQIKIEQGKLLEEYTKLHKDWNAIRYFEKQAEEANQLYERLIGVRAQLQFCRWVLGYEEKTEWQKIST